MSISIFFLMIRRPPRSTPKPSSAASDVYKRQIYGMALDDVYIMGVNLAAMVLTMIVLSMKLKYERLAQTTSE